MCVAYCHPGEVSHAFMLSMRGILLYDIHSEADRFRVDPPELALRCSTGGLVDGRNKIAEAFVNSEAEWLFMVDADMAFGDDTLERLLTTAATTGGRAVGALAFACKTDGVKEFQVGRYRSTPTIYQFVKQEGQFGVVPMMDYPKDEIVRCDATGMACVLLHRTLIEDLRAENGPRIFDPIVVGSQRFSEDLSFFLRVREQLGDHCWIDTSVRTAHHKGMLYLDAEHYDDERRLRAEVSEHGVQHTE